MTAAVAYISDAMARDAIRVRAPLLVFCRGSVRLVCTIQPLLVQLDMYKDVDEELRRKMRYNEVACLSLSFRQLVKISNLQPFVNVQQLQLDNNDIKRIENLDHMVLPRPQSCLHVSAFHATAQAPSMMSCRCT